MPDSLQYPPGTSQMYEGLMQYLHVDPTMATELAILLELAQRQRPAK